MQKLFHSSVKMSTRICIQQGGVLDANQNISHIGVHVPSVKIIQQGGGAGSKIEKKFFSDPGREFGPGDRSPPGRGMLFDFFSLGRPPWA